MATPPPPTEKQRKEILDIEASLDRLYREGEHGEIKAIQRRLLDIGLQAQFDMATNSWKVARQQSFEQLREGIMQEREEDKRSAKEKQQSAAQREFEIKAGLVNALKKIDSSTARGKMEREWLTRRAMEEIEDVRREAQRSEVRWGKPSQETREEAKKRMKEAFGNPDKPNPFAGRDEPRPWDDKDRKEQKEEEERRKKEEERLSAPDIDRSLAALLDGIDTDMRGEASGQEATDNGTDAAADAGGSGDSDGEEGWLTGREDDEEELERNDRIKWRPTWDL